MAKEWKRSLSQSDILSDGNPFDGAKIDQKISEAGAPLKYIGEYSVGKVEGPFGSISLTNINSGDCQLVDNDSLYFAKEVTSGTVIRFELSTDSLNSATETNRTDPFGSTTNPKGLAFNSDGSKVYTSGRDAETVESYTLSTLYDLTTSSFNASTDVSSQTVDPFIIRFNDDGTKLFLSELGSNIYTYDLSTAYDVTSKTFTRSTDFNSQTGRVDGFDFSPDGRNLVILNDSMFEYSLSSAYDTSTATFVNSFDVTGTDVTPRGFQWSQSGARSLLNGSANENALEYVHGRVVGK